MPAQRTGPRRWIQLTLLLLILLLGALLVAGVFAIRRLYHSGEARYVREALPLRTASRDVVLEMLNEETAVRGYLITRDRGSLGPYFAGRRGVQQDLRTIGRLARGRPELEAQLGVMRREIRSLDGFFARQITFVADSAEGLSAARRDVLAGTSRFDRFRATAAAMQAATEAVVRQTRADQRRTYRASLATLIAAGAGALAIALILFLRVPGRLGRLYSAERRARLRAEAGANAARALANVSEAVVLVDDGGVIRSWNTAAARLFGRDDDGAVGQPLESVPQLRAVAAAAAKGTTEMWPVEVAREERWVSAVVSQFDGGRVLTIRDVTDERRLEHARSEFVATAAHELRTPLSAVFGAAATLRERDLDEERRRQLLEMIHEESGRLAEIIEKLLITAQLDRGNLAMSEGECDLRVLVENVVRSAELHRPRGIEFSLRVPKRMEPVRCDEARLRQVLVNLVDNAMKYSPDGGLIEVRLFATPQPRVEISDEGLGIPPADQDRIFEKFFRLDPEMARGVGGSGLGLYISRRIVEQMGGRIRLTSAVGRGSLFTVELPASSRQAATAGVAGD